MVTASYCLHSAMAEAPDIELVLIGRASVGIAFDAMLLDELHDGCGPFAEGVRQNA